MWPQTEVQEILFVTLGDLPFYVHAAQLWFCRPDNEMIQSCPWHSHSYFFKLSLLQSDFCPPEQKPACESNKVAAKQLQTPFKKYFCELLKENFVKLCQRQLLNLLSPLANSVNVIFFQLLIPCYNKILPVCLSAVHEAADKSRPVNGRLASQICATHMVIVILFHLSLALFFIQSLLAF